MKTLVMTLPCSGTHFLLHFLANVLDLAGANDMGSVESDVDFIHIHPNGQDIPKGIFDSVIMTVREPHKTLRTAQYRGLVDQVEGARKAMMNEQKKYKTKMLVVIDGPEKDRFPQLMKIAYHFDKSHLREAVKQYAKAWIPLNARGIG